MTNYLDNRLGQVVMKSNHQIDWQATFRNLNTEQRARYDALVRSDFEMERALYGEPLDANTQKWWAETFMPAQEFGRFYIAAALGDRQLCEDLRRTLRDKLREE